MLDTHSKTPIGIIGSGVVGTILAAHLQHAGHPTLVVERGCRHEIIARDGIQVCGLVNMSMRPSRLVRSLSDLSEEERISPRLWCLCTKTWSIQQLLPSLARDLPQEARILAVQNGIGVEDLLSEVVGSHRVACLTVSFAGGVDEKDSAVKMVWFNPPNRVGVCGGSDQTAKDIASLLTSAGLFTEATSKESVKEKLFHKTILNVGLNALCAVTGTSMQEAMSMPHLRVLARTSMQEAITVGKALGYDFGPDTLSQAMSYIEKGAGHRPSMAVDLASKSPTEIDFINGKIVELAHDLPGVSAPTNHFLSALVVAQEVHNGTRTLDQVPHYLRQWPPFP